MPTGRSCRGRGCVRTLHSRFVCGCCGCSSSLSLFLGCCLVGASCACLCCGWRGCVLCSWAVVWHRRGVGGGRVRVGRVCVVAELLGRCCVGFVCGISRCWGGPRLSRRLVPCSYVGACQAMRLSWCGSWRCLQSSARAVLGQPATDDGHGRRLFLIPAAVPFFCWSGALLLTHLPISLPFLPCCALSVSWVYVAMRRMGVRTPHLSALPFVCASLVCG